jgi:hypothetical protein
MSSRIETRFPRALREMRHPPIIEREGIEPAESAARGQTPGAYNAHGMAGHSHWSKIKRAKGATDAKRGKVWSKIARKIIIAAKNGGDPRDPCIRYTPAACRLWMR